MPRRPRTPNSALARVMRSGPIGNAQLARRVNAVGREFGVPLSYDKTTVSHWLAGSVPRPEARRVIAEALSRLLGRPMGCAQIGWPGTDGDQPGERDAAAGVIDLSRADMDPTRRGVVKTGMYAAAVTVPAFADVASAAERPAPAAAGRTVRIGTGDVETVRTMTTHIAGILDQVGAGHARPMAAAFITNTVGPYLRASGTERTRRRMKSAAAGLVYLTGWMAMYEGAQGLGQQYYLRALELAGAADDHITYCRTLRGMSLQATHLGHGAKGLELADAAAEAAPVSGPRLVAFLRGQQAAAAAMTGDGHTARARLRETESALSRADDRRDAVGGYDRAAFHFHEGQVRWHLGERAESIASLRRANAARSPLEREGRLHCLGVIAERQIRMRHVEAACGTWEMFLDEYMSISSARGDEHLSTLLRALPAYRPVPGVRDLEDRARHVASLKSP
ncbi:hypothetical protein ABZ714_32055 [Streptomyces sp. NPDC006798]|uniref:hypothetical protein n=1 Tax=Streptomyces sp. NPDC006798 TaxID=3155462 RepID=UPI00340940DF